MDKPLPDTLDPCPFCGSEEIGLVRHSESPGLKQGQCTKCKACGPIFTDPARLARKWNTRTAPTIPEGATGVETIVWWSLSVKPRAPDQPQHDIHNKSLILRKVDGSNWRWGRYLKGDGLDRFFELNGGGLDKIWPDREDLYEWAYAPKGPETEENEE